MRLLLVGYGVAISIYGVFYFDQHVPPNSQIAIESGRQSLIQNSIAVLNQGGPPLLASPIPWREAKKHLPGPVYQANYGDDPGIYLYLPELGHLTGDDSAASLLRWFFIGSMALVLLTYPLVFYLLFDSIAMGVVAPLALLVRFHFLWNTDIFWVPAWAVLLCIPPILAVARLRWRPRLSIGVLFAATVVGSYANSIRSGAGTPIAVTAVIVALLRERGLIRRLLATVAVIIGYLSVNTLALAAVRAYRDHVAHLDVNRADLPASHPFWHPAYLGLGYLPNKWGIRWSDSVGLAAARRVDPNVVYLTPHYEHILRHLYFSILRTDPGYVARVYSTKIAVCVHAAASHFWPALVVLPFCLVLGEYRSDMRRNLLLMTPSLLATLAPAVMTIPSLYQMSWLGAVGLVALLVLGWAVTYSRECLRAWARRAEAQRTQGAGGWLAYIRAAWPGRARIPTRSILVALGGVALFAGIAAAASAQVAATADAVFDQYGATPLTPLPLPEATVLERWSFAGGIPSAWQLQPGAQSQAYPEATTIATTTGRYDYEVTGPALTLGRGSYMLAISGEPVSCGLGVAVVDVTNLTWIASGNFFYDEGDYTRNTMALPFTLMGKTLVRPILTNWERTDRSCVWSLKAVSLSREPRAAT